MRYTHGCLHTHFCTTPSPGWSLMNGWEHGTHVSWMKGPKLCTENDGRHYGRMVQRPRIKDLGYYLGRCSGDIKVMICPTAAWCKTTNRKLNTRQEYWCQVISSQQILCLWVGMHFGMSIRWVLSTYQKKSITFYTALMCCLLLVFYYKIII